MSSTPPHKPLVSVITPFYREERFLRETIQSVIDQSYDHWELLLIDDGSPDGSPEIAQEFASKYPEKIKYLHHKNRSNQGVCRSRNLGISHARGDLIAYLDADDIWLSEKLEKQVNIFQAHPEAAVLLEASDYWYNWEDECRDNVVIPVGALQDHLYTPPQLLLELYPLAEGAAPCPSGIMVRRNVHNSTLFVDKFVGPNAVYEDQAFLVQLYLKEKIFVSSQANNRYRQREASQVFNVHNDGRYHQVRHFFLKWFKKYLRRKKFRFPEVSDLLAKSLEPYRSPWQLKLDRFMRHFRS